jgi:hypothetical protein
VAEIFHADVPVAEFLSPQQQPGADGSSGSDGAAAGTAEAAAATPAAAAVDAQARAEAEAAALLLRDVAFLDTTVTVVDAHELLRNLHSIHTFRVGVLGGGV